MTTAFPARMGASWEAVDVFCGVLSPSFLTVATFYWAQFMRSCREISLAK